MFNFDNLDKRRTYIGLQYGMSFIAKQINKYIKFTCLLADIVYVFDIYYIFVCKR